MALHYISLYLQKWDIRVINIIRYLLFMIFLRKEKLALILIILIMLPGIGYSDSWFGYVKTTDDFWSVYRHGDNMSFESDQYIEGEIKAFVGPRGRVLSPYCSHFENMNLIDVRHNERTAASEGNYSSQEHIDAWAQIRMPVGLDIAKSTYSDTYLIKFIERWQANISASQRLEYSGKGINNRDFSGNNFDFVGANLLFNKNLSKDRTIEMRLDKMNATVLATDNDIIQVERKPTRDLNYQISTSTTGIADLRYQQSGHEFEQAPLTGYEIINRGEERYYGAFNMTKKIRMKSQFPDSMESDHWLPCCYQGWKDMNIFDKKTLNADEIFNCACSRMQGEKS